MEASQVDASAHTPSDPGATGVTGYEYTGTQNEYIVDPGDVMVVSGFGATGSRPIRLNADMYNDSFQMTADIGRYGVDVLGSGLRLQFNVPNTAIGSYDNNDYYFLQIARSSVSTVSAGFYRRDGAGTETDISTTSTGTVTLGISGTRRIRVIVDNLTAYAYASDYGTGDNEVTIATATLPADLRDATHTRFGVGMAGLSSGATYCANLCITDLPGPGTTTTSTTTTLP